MMWYIHDVVPSDRMGQVCHDVVHSDQIGGVRCHDVVRIQDRRGQVS